MPAGAGPDPRSVKGGRYKEFSHAESSAFKGTQKSIPALVKDARDASLWSNVVDRNSLLEVFGL